MGSATRQNTLQTDWIDITQSDILSIVSTPVTLLDAPWAGKVILVQQFLLEFTAGGTPYTYASNLFLNMWAFTIFNLGNPLTGASVLKTVGWQSATLTENTALVITGGGSDPTAGDGTMKIKLFYTIEEL